MHIKLSPMRHGAPIDSIERQGDTLTINGESYDFSQLPEGATLPASAIDSDWLSGDVERINGELHLTLHLPHGANAPEETRFPDPLHVTVDGPITLPPYDIEPEPEPEVPDGD